MSISTRAKLILILVLLIISFTLLSSVHLGIHSLDYKSHYHYHTPLNSTEQDVEQSSVILNARNLIERAKREVSSSNNGGSLIFSTASNANNSSTYYSSSAYPSSSYSSYSSYSPSSSYASSSAFSSSSWIASSSSQMSSSSWIASSSSEITSSSSIPLSSSSMPSSSLSSESVFTTLSTNSANERITVTVTLSQSSTSSSASPSPSLSTSSRDSNTDSGGLSRNNKIVVGCVVGIGVPLLLLLAFLAYWFLYKKGSRSSMNSSSSPNHSITSLKNEELIGDSLSHTGEDQVNNVEVYDDDELTGNTYRGSSRVNPATNF